MPADDFKEGDRVYVLDDGLAQLRQMMRTAGTIPHANHHGTVESVEDDERDRVWVIFDNEDGPAQGGGAPFPPGEVRHLPEYNSPQYAPWPWEASGDA